MQKVKYGALWVLVVVLILLSQDVPMSLTFALGLLVVLFEKRLQAFFMRYSPGKSFLISGLLLSALIETFAYFDNMSKPIGERVLAGQTAFQDFVLAGTFYVAMVVVWYVFYRRYAFSARNVFFITAFIGIITEQFNPAVGGPVILINAFLNPVVGLPMMLIVGTVYGIFAGGAALITNNRFENRKPLSKKIVILSVVSLWITWAILGNFVYPVLRGWLGMS